MIFMVTTCAYPNCLRPPASNYPNATCAPCAKGLPPMTNPLSPHAAANAGGFVPRIEKSGKPIQDGEAVMGIPKVVSPTAQPKPAISQPNQPKLSIDKPTAKKAVQLIFNMEWANYDGMPKLLEEMYSQFGNFIKVTTKPSNMVGLPKKHRGLINVRAIDAYVLLIDTILPMEGRRATMKTLETNPLFVESRGKISAEDMLYAIDNDGTPQDFSLSIENKSKPDDSVYSYQVNNVVKMIPRWAIS